jgi:hypothetical protein
MREACGSAFRAVKMSAIPPADWVHARRGVMGGAPRRIAVIRMLDHIVFTTDAARSFVEHAPELLR